MTASGREQGPGEGLLWNRDGGDRCGWQRWVMVESSVGENDAVLFPRCFNFSSSKSSSCQVAHPEDPPQPWLGGKLCAGKAGKAQAGAHHPTLAGQRVPADSSRMFYLRVSDLGQELFLPSGGVPSSGGTFPVTTGSWFNWSCV